ncbi:response regulator [Rhizorhabdus argentea]|uniref:response regulator n=1 Tax=Rhizorhabdus argentea TaxID=1387174 RepID=UPI0030EB80E9
MNTSPRILIVEDQPLIGLALCDALDEMGLTSIGPVQALSEALRVASNDEFDAALLDIWLHGVPAYAVGEILLHRRIPFIVTGGVTNPNEPEPFRHAQRLAKPFSKNLLRERLCEIGVLPTCAASRRDC